MPGCSAVPRNQQLVWYENALCNYGRGNGGNGGEGKDYEYDELKIVYFEKCASESEKENKKLEKIGNTMDNELLKELQEKEKEIERLNAKLLRGYEICKQLTKLVEGEKCHQG